MLNTLWIQGGLLEVKIGDKFVSIGIDGKYIFVGCRIGVFVQIKDKLAQQSIAMHLVLTWCFKAFKLCP
jgi:hypothetical protein